MGRILKSGKPVKPDKAFIKEKVVVDPDAEVIELFDVMVRVGADTLKRIQTFSVTVGTYQKDFTVNKDLMFVWQDVENYVEEKVQAMFESLRPKANNLSKVRGKKVSKPLPTKGTIRFPTVKRKA